MTQKDCFGPSRLSPARDFCAVIIGKYMSLNTCFLGGDETRPTPGIVSRICWYYIRSFIDLARFSSKVSRGGHIAVLRQRSGYAVCFILFGSDPNKTYWGAGWCIRIVPRRATKLPELRYSMPSTLCERIHGCDHNLTRFDFGDS